MARLKRGWEKTTQKLRHQESKEAWDEGKDVGRRNKIGKGPCNPVRTQSGETGMDEKSTHRSQRDGKRTLFLYCAGEAQKSNGKPHGKGKGSNLCRAWNAAKAKLSEEPLKVYEKRTKEGVTVNWKRIMRYR